MTGPSARRASGVSRPRRRVRVGGRSRTMGGMGRAPRRPGWAPDPMSRPYDPGASRPMRPMGQSTPADRGGALRRTAGPGTRPHEGAGYHAGPVQRRRSSVPEAHVVSVAGPRPVGALGVVDAHDHLFLDSPAMPGQGVHGHRALDRGGPRRAGERDRDDRRDDAHRARPAAGRDAGRGRGDGPDRHRRVRLPPRRPLPRGPLGPRRDGRDARRPDRDRPDGGDAPVRLERPRAPARPGEGRRDQGRRLVPPDHAQRAQAPRGHRRGRRPDRRRRPRPHRDRDLGPRRRRPPRVRRPRDRPDRPRAHGPQPRRGAARRDRRPRRDARVRHHRPHQVPPRQPPARPDRGHGHERVHGQPGARPRPRRPRLPARVRRRPRACAT